MLRLLLLLVFLFTASAEAATCTSRTSGNWSSNNTWNCGSGTKNGPPVAGDAVVVASGHSVTLETDTASLLSLTVSGSITGDSSSRAINLNGNLINNGSISVTGGTSSRLVLQGASTWSGNGSLTLDYLDTNWQTLNLDSASTMAISLTDADPLRNINGFNNGASPNKLATVSLSGTSAQTYDDYNLQMPNLVLSGSSKTVTASALIVLGNLTINSGATLNTDTVSNVTLGGNLLINGTLNSFSGGSTVWTFNGSAAQSISTAASFRSVVLNNSSGLTVGGNLTVGDSSWGNLTLSSGKLTTGTYAVIIPRNCSGSMVTRSAGAWINGNQKLTMPAWNVVCVFDVGDSANYAPVTFSYPWHAAPLGGTVTAGATGGDHPDTTAALSGINPLKSVNRYWNLSAGGGSTFYTYDATFQYCNAAGTADCTVNDVDAGATAGSFVVAAKSTTGAWASSTPTAPATNSRQIINQTSFGAFAIGEPGTASGCPPPSNFPAGLSYTCQCDSFGRSSLNPSPMFTSSNWIVSTSDSTGVVPYINTSTGFLRLTERTSNNAKAATVPGFFPAAGNYISVEFLHYAYNGSGADGIAIALSDYAVPAVPGGYGGSLGYAQKSGISGFAGGWIGVGIDEFGNYSNPTEGRILGRGFIVDGVAVRGSGSGQTGYPYLGGTSGSLSPGIDNAGSTSPAYGHYYQIIVDARKASLGQTWVAVNRDTSGAGTSYSPVVASFDAFAAATAAGYTQAAVPTNWQLSFTGSTGGSTNIHELGKVRICAQDYVPPDGGTAGGFSAIDDANSSAVQSFLTGHIFTKLVSTPFKLKVAALSNSQIQTTYAASGTKSVSVKLVDNSDGLCGTDASRVTECAKSACNGKSAVGGGSQTLSFTSADKGIKTSADFTLPSAYANLVAVMTDGTTTACSVDSFAVRPTKFTSVTSNASNTALTGDPKFKAGSSPFTLSVTANAGGYTGMPKIDTAAIRANTAAWAVGAFSPSVFPKADSGVSSSVASGSFTYGEVGHFRFLGFDPASDTASRRGIYDDDWVAVDSAATKNDCVANSYANTKDSSGKYGCLFGLQDSGSAAPNSALFGRFVPDHFTYLGGGLSQFCAPVGGNAFSYMGQPALGIAYRLQAENGSGVVTTNYSAALGYPVTNPTLVAEDQASANQGCDLAGRISNLASAQWTAGIYALNDSDANNKPDTSTASFSRPTVPLSLDAASCTANKGNAGGPFWLLDIGVAMSDSDANAVLNGSDMNVATTGACSGAGCTARKIGTTGMAYGRLWLNNAYGSEMLPLAVPVNAQFWTASGWQKNTYDSCTQLTQPTRQDSGGNGGLTFYAPPNTARNALAPGEVISQMSGSTAISVALQAGDARMVLRHPSSPSQGPGTDNFGYVDIIGSKLGTSSWLPPTGNVRACFGACGPRSPVIYLRESY